MNEQNTQKPNLSRYYKGRTLTREKIFLFFEDYNYFCTSCEQLGIDSPLQIINTGGKHRLGKDPHLFTTCLLFHKELCYRYERVKNMLTDTFSLVEIIKIEGEYQECVMVYSRSTIGKLLYGTPVRNILESITVKNCVEIDFLEHLDDPNLGVLASDVESLKKCKISPVIPEVNSFDAIFVFTCSEEVQEYLNDIINQKQNNHE